MPSHVPFLQGVDAVAANAAAQGLIHLGSYYVNSSASTAPLGGLNGMNGNGSSMNGSDMQHSSSGSGSGRGLRQQQQQQPGSSKGPYGVPGSYRPAPRTLYTVSRLYAMSGSQVGWLWTCAGGLLAAVQRVACSSAGGLLAAVLVVCAHVQDGDWRGCSGRVVLQPSTRHMPPERRTVHPP